MNNWNEMVQEFHEANKRARRNSVANVPLHPPMEVRVLRLRLMMEELGELSVAMEQEELVNVADGLTDLLYVVVGTAVCYGMGGILDEMFREVHRSNMSKDFIDRPGGGKGAIKGFNYTPPDLASIILREQTRQK
jgi:predicted HAD superfamily Cof-like phosphohydrolase